MAKGKNKRPKTESKMNDETKPETQESAGAADAGADQSNAPVAQSDGIADQSAAASDAAADTGATTAEPEPAGAAAEGAAAPAPEATVTAPAPSLADVIAAAPVQAPEPSPAPVVQAPPPAPAPQPPAPPVAPVVQEMPSESVAGITPYADVNRLLAGVPKAKHGIIHFLLEYARDMAPKRPVTPERGGSYQADLYRALHALINKEDEHFRPLFTAVLRVFEHEANGCFRATHVFRFMENVKLNKDERHSFSALIDMLRLLGPVEGRKDAAKQVDLSKTLAKNMSDVGRSRVLSYFDGTI